MRVVGGSDLEGLKGPAQQPGGQHSGRGSTKAWEHAEGEVCSYIRSLITAHNGIPFIAKVISHETRCGCLCASQEGTLHQWR